MFTRLSDDETLLPLQVFGPYEQSRESRHIVRFLMESSEVRVSYLPMGYRRGEYQCLFATYEDAYSATTFFSVFSEFVFEGPTVPAGTLIQEGGYLIESDGTPDAGFSMQFIVAPGDLTITQNGLWELRVPYQEVALE